MHDDHICWEPPHVPSTWAKALDALTAATWRDWFAVLLVAACFVVLVGSR